MTKRKNAFGFLCDHQISVNGTFYRVALRQVVLYVSEYWAAEEQIGHKIRRNENSRDENADRDEQNCI